MNSQSPFAPPPNWPDPSRGYPGNGPPQGQARTIPFPQAPDLRQPNGPAVHSQQSAPGQNGRNDPRAKAPPGPAFPELGVAGPWLRWALDLISPTGANPPSASGGAQTGGSFSSFQTQLQRLRSRFSSILRCTRCNRCMVNLNSRNEKESLHLHPRRRLRPLTYDLHQVFPECFPLPNLSTMIQEWAIIILLLGSTPIPKKHLVPVFQTTNLLPFSLNLFRNLQTFPLLMECFPLCSLVLFQVEKYRRRSTCNRRRRSIYNRRWNQAKRNLFHLHRIYQVICHLSPFHSLQCNLRMARNHRRLRKIFPLHPFRSLQCSNQTVLNNKHSQGIFRSRTFLNLQCNSRLIVRYTFPLPILTLLF
jgi:hypothetical protein